MEIVPSDDEHNEDTLYAGLDIARSQLFGSAKFRRCFAERMPDGTAVYLHEKGKREESAEDEATEGHERRRLFVSVLS